MDQSNSKGRDDRRWSSCASSCTEKPMCIALSEEGEVKLAGCSEADSCCSTPDVVPPKPPNAPTNVNKIPQSAPEACANQGAALISDVLPGWPQLTLSVHYRTCNSK